MEIDDFLIFEEEETPVAQRCDYESDELRLSREQDRAGREIEVLILVKTAPTPSEKYVETVCVAGIALNPYRLVRLYPIAYRLAEDTNKFKKYSIVSLKVAAPRQDPRYESLRVDMGSIRTKTVLKDWKRRAGYVEQMPMPTMCELLEEIRNNPNATSLAIIEPAEITKLEIKPHNGWSERQKEVIQKHQEQSQLDTIDGESTYIPNLLPPAYEVRLHYKCKSPTCKGHKQGIIDWELRALQRRENDIVSDKLEEMIYEKFFRNPTKPGKRTLLFVGNQANAMKRGIFSILGMYYPKELDAQPALF